MDFKNKLGSFDLIVIGGGASGAFAAVAAAREGLRVLIVEKNGFLGGSATNCLVNPYMPYYIRLYDEEKISRFRINRGLFGVVLDELNEIGGLHDDGLTFNEEYLKLILDRLCKNSGVKVLFHSQLIKVENNDRELTSIMVANKSGISNYSAKYFLDCSGDADMAAMSGCSFRLGRDGDNLCQPLTLNFRLSGVNINQFEENRHTINILYKQFQKEGKIKNLREDVLIMNNCHDGVLHFNTTRVIKKNPLNAEDLSSAEFIAREQVYEMYQFLKNNIKGFENCKILTSGPSIGVRESRLINGEYLLTAEDLFSYKVFEDSIAVGAYEIDIHSPDGSGTVIKRLEESRYYTIPYRSLIPKGKKNLLVAGRSISATHEAQSAIRIMPIVANIGESAGLAASLAFKANSSFNDVDIQKLHMLLDKYDIMYK